MNWNVYKIFKNGKRAKAPMATFEYNDNPENVIEYFEVADAKVSFRIAAISGALMHPRG